MLFKVLVGSLATASALQVGTPLTRRDAFGALAAGAVFASPLAANAAPEAVAIWKMRKGVGGMTEKVPSVAKGCNVRHL